MRRYVIYHRDGSIWAEGWMQAGASEGYWEWFRQDGTKMRSGHFKRGKPVGEWITYDKAGRVFKVVHMSGNT